MTLLCLICGAAQGRAAQLCVLPVDGGEPQLDVERKQPYRIATDPRRVPGFDGLLVHAFNRHEILEFDGRELHTIDSAFPHVWGFAFQAGIHIAPNGDAFGFGERPRAIYSLKRGDRNWRLIDVTRGYVSAAFDEGSGDVYVRMSKDDPQLQKLRFHDLVPADLPKETVWRAPSVRTIPQLSGTLFLGQNDRPGSTAQGAMWYKPKGGTWEQIRLHLPSGQRLLHDLSEAAIDIDGTTLRIFPNSSDAEPLFFTILPDGLTFAGTAPAGDWAYHPASETWIGWSGEQSQRLLEHRWFWFDKSLDPVPPKAFVLRKGRSVADPLEGLQAPFGISGDYIFYLPRLFLLGKDQPALLTGANGLEAFDGTTLRAVADLTYDRIGHLPHIETLGGKTIIQSDRGVFLLNNDLTANRVDSFPIAAPWLHEVEIRFMDQWNTFVTVDRRSGAVFAGSDMSVFTRIEAPAKMERFVGALPERSALLIVGEDRLYRMTDDCGG